MTDRDRWIYVLAGTATLHIAIAVALASVDRPAHKPPEKAPLVMLEQVPIPPAVAVKEPEPAPAPEPEPDKPPPPPDTTPPPPTAHVEKQRTVRTVTTETRSTETPDSDAVVVPGGGGDGPTLKIENLGSGTVAVEQGKTTKQRHGTGGTGGGSGSGAGSGSGTGSAPETVVSIASIKTRAMPTGDYYDDGSKDYPADAKREGIEGVIKVRLTVSAKGEVTAAKLLNKLGHGLDELALSRAKKFEFTPALDTDDHAVASIVVWTFTFKLPE